MVILGLNGLAVSILNDSEAQVEYWHKNFVGCKISPSLLTVGGHIRVLPCHFGGLDTICSLLRIM